MIQRIQTLYLLLAAGLVACAAFLPLASFASGGEEFRLYAFGLRTADGETVQSTLYMGILLALALVLPLTTIFLFKRRMLQFRLGVVEMILLLGAQIVMGIYYFLSYRLFSSFEFHAQSVKLPLVLPLIAMIFTYLAVRAIFRDELMIRSMDRIRSESIRPSAMPTPFPTGRHPLCFRLKRKIRPERAKKHYTFSYFQLKIYRFLIGYSDKRP